MASEMTPNEKGARAAQIAFLEAEYRHWKDQIDYCEQQRKRAQDVQSPTPCANGGVSKPDS